MDLEQAQAHAYNVLLDYPRLHLANYYHRTAENTMLNFADNKWQQKLYMEDADRIVVMKSSKVGISEWLICDMFTQAKLGLNGMYVLPDQPIRNRFISSRIDRVIGNTGEYNANVVTKKKDVNAKGLKTIYNKTWAFVGANNPDTFYEFNSDINIYDEYDKCNQLSLETATDRTLGSSCDRWRKVGNPTISGYGISEELDKSCQYTWHLKCWRCNKWQPLGWFTHFVDQEDNNVYRLKDSSVPCVENPDVGDDAKGYCIKCGKPIDRLGHGNWVDKHLDRDIKGFHVMRLFGSVARNRNVIREDFKKMIDCVGNLSLMQWFYNNRLGIPYEADGSKITEALLSECVQADYVMPDKVAEGKGYSIGGADIGAKIHIQASLPLPDGRRKKVCICTVPLNMEAFEAVIKKYRIAHGVVDALPETDFVKRFLQRNRGWARCFYGQRENPNLSIDYIPKEKKVKAGRTETLDASLLQYLTHNMILPKNFMSIDGGNYVKQMIMPTRIYDEKTERFIWTKGEDHYRHADNYENIAFDIFRAGGINIRVY